MKAFEVSIPKSSRDYGYLFWKHTQDDDAKQFFRRLSKVHIWTDGIDIGERRIDWDARRIYIGVRPMRNLRPKASVFRLEFSGEGEVQVTTL